MGEQRQARGLVNDGPGVVILRTEIYSHVLKVNFVFNFDRIQEMGFESMNSFNFGSSVLSLTDFKFWVVKSGLKSNGSVLDEEKGVYGEVELGSMLLFS